MYRSERDESRFTPAEVIAWEMVLPHRHVPVLPYDRERAEQLAKKLEQFFDAQALEDAAGRVQKTQGRAA